MAGSRLAAVAGGLSALVLGLLLVFYVIPTYVPEPALAAGTAPGPRAVPLMLAWGFIIIGAFEAIMVLRSGTRIQWSMPEGIGRLLVVSAIILAALLVMPLIGMVPAGVAMMVALTTAASGQRLMPSLLTAFGFGAVIYLIFVLLAGIPLPGGSLWE